MKEPKYRPRRRSRAGSKHGRWCVTLCAPATAPVTQYTHTRLTQAPCTRLYPGRRTRLTQGAAHGLHTRHTGSWHATRRRRTRRDCGGRRVGDQIDLRAGVTRLTHAVSAYLCVGTISARGAPAARRRCASLASSASCRVRRSRSGAWRKIVETCVNHNNTNMPRSWCCASAVRVRHGRRRSRRPTRSARHVVAAAGDAPWSRASTTGRVATALSGGEYRGAKYQIMITSHKPSHKTA